MAQLNWRHHTLIQALLSRGPLKEDEFHSVFTGITGKNPATHHQLFNDFLLMINKGLAYVQFELRGCRNQYDGNIYYGVVNNVADEQSKLGTKYSVPQIAFYKAVIEAIIQDVTNQGCITNIEALNIRLENQIQPEHGSQGSQSRIPTAVKSFSLSQKEKTLNDLIHDRWLCSTSDGKIGLGIRSFLDLRSWFRNNDIPPCDVCSEAGVKAATCPKEGCPVRIHDYCLKNKFSQRKVAKVCPSCGTKWHPTECIEEEETMDPEPSDHPPATRKRLRSSKAEAVEAVEAANAENLSHDPELRKRLRSCKAEAVDAAARAVSCQSSGASNAPRRTRSKRV